MNQPLPGSPRAPAFGSEAAAHRCSLIPHLTGARPLHVSSRPPGTLVSAHTGLVAEHTLILLRHAKSDWSGHEGDHDRPLAKRGRRQAPDAGRWLAVNVDPIDLAVVSTAKRARTTWDLVSEELDQPPNTHYDDDAYAAPVGEPSTSSAVSTRHLARSCSSATTPGSRTSPRPSPATECPCRPRHSRSSSSRAHGMALVVSLDCYAPPGAHRPQLDRWDRGQASRSPGGASQRSGGERGNAACLTKPGAAVPDVPGC